MEKTHLTIGLGQIGSAIREIVGGDGLDINNQEGLSSDYDILHIAIPFSDSFIETVKGYQERFTPEITIIHSTVPVGTSEILGAVHSPVRGIHPHLKEGILTFEKFFGGEKAEEASKIFEAHGIKTIATKNSRDTEAMKLWDTTVYGWNIILEKIIHKYCVENNLDFDVVYTKSNQSYNEGYEKLGHPEYKKYILKHVEGKIGGHCVVPNLELLGGEVSEFIKKLNENL